MLIFSPKALPPKRITALSYTRQRNDETGLLFDNARPYDPKLAPFLSVDTIAPNRTDPQTRNR
jgi:RHS repeat-associated protein